MNKYLLREAGGAAARSAYLFLTWMGIEKEMIVVQDINKNVILGWNSLGIEEYDPLRHPLITDVPTDEYHRLSGEHTSTEFSSTELAAWHDKGYAQEFFKVNTPETFKYPHYVKGYCVGRKKIGAGSKSFEVLALPKGEKSKVYTQFISVVREYVIDFYVTKDNHVGMLARQTHELKHGSDTLVTLLPENECKPVIEATHEFIKLSKWKGIGNLQLIEDKFGDLYFVEVAARLSGNSWVGLEVCYNPFRLMIMNQPWSNIEMKTMYCALGPSILRSII